MEDYVYSISGEYIEEKLINETARKMIDILMSQLPEEARTSDVMLYVLKRTKRMIKGAKITAL